MMWWVVLAVLHIVAIGLWYHVTTLPNRGTGGLSALVMPVLVTILAIITDVVVIINTILK